MTLSSPVTEIKGIGQAAAKRFAVLGVQTVADLLHDFPRRYDDYSQLLPIAKLQPGAVSVAAQLTSIKGRYVRRGMHVTEAIMSDESGSVRVVWFNQPYREQSMKKGAEYFVSGTFGLSHQRFAIMNPSTELASDFPVNTARIIPIYRETKGLTSRQIRSAVQACLPLISELPETLPPWLLSQYKLVSHSKAVRQMHFPDNVGTLQQAKRRLGFEEVFELILASLANKQELATEQAPPVAFDESVAKNFVQHLPFKLTDAQRKVVWQVYQDMQRPQPMNRLVEGDVGSGKTVVAAMAALMVLHHGHLVALMAPTELLARQHAETIYNLLSPLGLGDMVGLLIGGMKRAQKELAQQRIAEGHIRFIIGTHALIQEGVDMLSLELVIIDEQHRFGVEQRKTLQTKAGHMPHVLTLTATPIPRSLALTLYGELDISVLDVKPAGRQPIETRLIPPSSRPRLYEEITQELQTGRQMFVVCPLISPSDALEGPAGQAAAETVYERFRSQTFKSWRIGLLHGRLKANEKQAVMEQFVRHEIDILISTTVIEVGVDVPNASIMMVEAAERFGLAQIHQLRGRVGRGGHKGYCYLLLSDAKQPSKRLEALERSNDGFRLAELDLELRGPGAIYGSQQHGELDLRIAKLTDTKLISEARQAAQRFLDQGEDLLQYKELAARVAHLRAVTNLN